MRARVVPGLLSALACATAIACGQSPDASPDDEQAATAITGGVVDEAHPAAGLLTMGDGELLCGGTLVARNVVLTAAHCLGASPTDFYLGKGVPITIFDPPSRALSRMRRYRVAEVLPFPGFERAQAADSRYVCTRDRIDVALVRLAEPVTDVTPVPLGAAPAAGARCEVVGYSTHKYAGREYETRYERRRALREVRETASYRIFSRGIDGPTRTGDSGGGLFCEGKLVGVLSCTTPAEDDHARFDVVRGWVDFQIERWR